MSKLLQINKDEAVKILEAGLSTGADFCEVFMEDTINYSLEMVSGEVTDISNFHVTGASIRIIKDDVAVNGCTSEMSYDALIKLANKLASNFEGAPSNEIKEFNDTTRNSIVHIDENRANDDPVPLLKKAYVAAKEYSNEIIQVICSATRKNQKIHVFANDGTWAKDRRLNTRLGVSCIASDGKNMQSSGENEGGNSAMDLYDNFDMEELGRSAAESAVKMLHADEMVGGDIPVVIHNGFGGVILHESCGHSLEAAGVAKGMSVNCGKLGKKIASDIVNAVDSGIHENEWGSLNVDDEGTPTRCNVLIENGILKSYLVDKQNSKKMNHPITASSRRESYKHVPTARMTNTYFLNGTSTFEEIIANTKYGLFAKKMGGGSVNPATGEFNFAVNEGYMIEDGKITKPVRGATLVGSGKDVLLRIDMISNNLSLGYGMCGASSGSIPACVGQPTIRVSHLTVGGKGGK